MKELVPKDEYGVFVDKKDTARVDSLFVARTFEKRHFHVLRDIEKITDTKSGLSEKFIKTNFIEDSYQDNTGRKLKCYQMTRDGFTMLVMSYTGEKAMRFKELYIRRFNEMEDFIKELKSAREMFPELTDAIKETYDSPKPYYYSNECDMINKIVLGMSAKQFKKLNHIPKEENSIRPYLSDIQIKMIDELQRKDSGLILAVSDYSERKKILENYVYKKYGI